MPNVVLEILIGLVSLASKCCMLVHGSRWSIDVWRAVAIRDVDFALARSFLHLALDVWQFLYNEFDGRTRRTADPIRPSVYCGLLARVDGLGAVPTLSSVLSVFSPV